VPFLYNFEAGQIENAVSFSFFIVSVLTMEISSAFIPTNASTLLVGKPEGRRQLGRPRLGWVDNIEMDFGDVGWGGMNWIDLAQDRD
jgi:hypothetical protein